MKIGTSRRTLCNDFHRIGSFWVPPSRHHFKAIVLACISHSSLLAIVLFRVQVGSIEMVRKCAYHVHTMTTLTTECMACFTNADHNEWTCVDAVILGSSNQAFSWTLNLTFGQPSDREGFNESSLTFYDAQELPQVLCVKQHWRQAVPCVLSDFHGYNDVVEAHSCVELIANWWAVTQL